MNIDEGLKDPPQIRAGKALFIKRGPSPIEEKTFASTINPRQKRGFDHLSDTCYEEKMKGILRSFSNKNKHQDTF